MNIGIIGTGVYSTSIALLLATNKTNSIFMWSENEELIKNYQETKKLNTIFKDKTIPKNISVSNDYEEVLDNIDVLFLMTSVLYLDEVCKNIKKIINPSIPIYIGTKGIALDSKKMVHEIVKKHLKNKITIMAGPTFARDIEKLEPIGFTIASKDKKSRLIFRKLFSPFSVLVEESTDLNGVALCGCMKNIYALGSGIIAGLGYNESTRTLYLNKVYEELSDILYGFKSSLETLNSLAGFGDLILTTSSSQSRNFTYGKMLGKKMNKKKLTKYLEVNTVEGINTLNAIYHNLKRKHIKCPIINCLNDIINNDEQPKRLIQVMLNKND